MRISQGTCVRGGLTGWVLLALALAGCGVKDEHTAAAVASSPKRVICASPAVAEIVFALGGGDRVVGVSEFTDWPPEAAGKTSIGGALSPNRERILALEPDLILAQGNAEALDTLDDLRAAISGFAAALGVKEQGQQRLAEMESGFAAIPSCGPVPVFIAVGHVPGDFSGLMTSGPGTFLDEIVARAGGSNIFSDLQILWPKISQETLIRRKPAVVLDFQSTAADETRRAALVADWERLGFDAGQIRILPEDYLLKPGPRAAQSAARIAEAICQ